MYAAFAKALASSVQSTSSSQQRGIDPGVGGTGPPRMNVTMLESCLIPSGLSLVCPLRDVLVLLGREEEDLSSSWWYAGGRAAAAMVGWLFPMNSKLMACSSDSN